MSSRATALIARRSIRARFGRLIAISVAILVGVSFVVGSFVLADSLRKTFDNLFTQISENVDLQVRASVAFGEGDASTQRDPIPASLADTIAQVDGVKAVEPGLTRYAQLVKNGEAIKTQGAPTLGVAWAGDESLSGLRIKGEGRPPSGPDEVAIDKATADRKNLEVGDAIEVITDVGTGTYRITGSAASSASKGRWNAANPRNTPASTAAPRVCARAARTMAAAAASPSTNDSWYPSSVADWTQVNGESATIAAAMSATRRRSRSCHANA